MTALPSGRIFTAVTHTHYSPKLTMFPSHPPLFLSTVTLRLSHSIPLSFILIPYMSFMAVCARTVFACGFHGDELLPAISSYLLSSRACLDFSFSLFPQSLDLSTQPGK